MEKIKHFNGSRYYLDKEAGYYITTRAHKTRLHRDVWEFHNGKIPKGYHIHHIDGDKANNEITNLVCMSPQAHAYVHGLERSPEQKARMRANLIEKAVPAAASRGISKEQREELRERYARNKHKLLRKKLFTCEQCGESYTGTDRKVNRFCSNRCKSKWRRETGADEEDRVCAYCSRTFRTNKYKKAKTCSRACANRSRASIT